MSEHHRVRQGECMQSLGFRYGFHPDTLWRHDRNAALRKGRANPNILAEGDDVFIPDPRIREVAAATGRRHVFRRLGVPALYRVRFLTYDGRPRAGLAYRLSVDGSTRAGTTDADGALCEPIPPDARLAKLVLFARSGEGDEAEEWEEHYEAALGHLDPVTLVSGVQARLSGLGYACRVTGSMDPATSEALSEFQRRNRLEVTGSLDDPTRAALVEAYGA
jgi:N-acetylmuramoyl-L-alanine amidase